MKYLLLFDAGDFDVDVDAIQERTADFFLVAGDRHGGTTAFFHRVPVITARAGVRVAVAATIFYELCTYPPSEMSRESTHYIRDDL